MISDSLASLSKLSGCRLYVMLLWRHENKQLQYCYMSLEIIIKCTEENQVVVRGCGMSEVPGRLSG